LASVHVSELVPALVNVRLWEMMVNGPPAPPVEVKPVAGVIRSGSGNIHIAYAAP
jgi:hypothetical protein